MGYTFRRVSFLHKVETTISLTVFFMLFVFGLSIGSNDKLMDNLGKYGYQAFILALFGVVGSCWHPTWLSVCIQERRSQ